MPPEDTVVLELLGVVPAGEVAGEGPDQANVAPVIFELADKFAAGEEQPIPPFGATVTDNGLPVVISLMITY